MKSGANFKDRSEIQRMVEEDFTIRQISSLLRIQPAVVEKIVAHMGLLDEEVEVEVEDEDSED